MSKTQDLRREMIDTDLLHPNLFNPNEMDDRSFNLLYDNIGQVGLTDPILVRPHPELKGEYKIIGGEHRWEAAKLHELKQVPCTIIEDDDFTEDDEKFQLMRHNMIKGKLSPKKFLEMYRSLNKELTDELAAEAFGFTDEEEFQKLIQETKKGLPPEMQAAFDEAKDEIKTIDDLARVLNRLFAKFGDTLPYNYMILDYGGKETVWVRMEAKNFPDLLTIANRCREKDRSLDHFLEGIIIKIADEELEELVEEILESCPKVGVSFIEGKLPSLDFLDD